MGSKYIPRHFIIEARTEKRETLLWFKIEQAALGKATAHDDNRLYNQVREYLDDQQEKTGLYYFIRCWGSPSFCESYIEEKQIEVH